MLGTIALLWVIFVVLAMVVCPLILFACCVSEGDRRRKEAGGELPADLVHHRTM